MDALKRFFSLIFLLASLALIIYAIGIVGKKFRFSSTTRLERLWTADLINLAKDGKLPAQWSEIREIDKIAATGDRLAARWVSDVNVPIRVNPSGDYKLQILYLSQSKPPHLRALIQLTLVHIKTGNSIWELDRTYNLK